MVKNVLAAVLIAVFLSSCSKEPSSRDLEVGDMIPPFEVVSCTGETVTGDSLSRGCSLIGFFNTACGDCREELDVLQEFYSRHSEEISFLLVSRGQSASSVQEYWDGHGYDMPFSAQKDSHVFRMFARSGIPRVYMSVEGRILAAFSDGPMASLDDLEFIVEYYRHWK